MQPDPSAKALQIILSLAVIVLSATTFLIGHRKRIAERRAGWYHKVVVDAGLEKIFEFFKQQDAMLNSAAEDCQRSVAAGRKTLSSKVTATISEFSEHLIEVQNFISDRLIVFDEESTTALNLAFEELQDNVSVWFEGYVVKKRYNLEELRGIQLESQRRILKILYECEFKNF